jgi:hypothetical protein
LIADSLISKRLPSGAVVLALMLTASAYLFDLDGAPVYLGGDEAHFAVQGYALATTGGDLKGTTWPLFVNLWDPQGDMAIQERFHAWYQPLLFYILALTLKVLPLSVVSVRLPTAIIGGLLSPLLTYVVAMRLLKDRGLALLAMSVLALAPPLLILSRQTLDYVLPIPFVLGWLWCLITFLETGEKWRAFAGGLVLGVGFYSYIASWMFMPMCLVLAWVTFFRTRTDALRVSVLATAGFLIPLTLLFPWAWRHPETLRYTVGRYLIHEGEGLTLMQGAQRFAASAHLTDRIGAYVSYFDPTFLLIRGGVSQTTATRSGVFLIAGAVFIAAGLYEIAKRLRREPIALVLLAGVLLAPIPATLLNESRMIQRELSMLPFAALIAAYGGAVLFHHRRVVVRWIGVLLIAVMLGQFAFVSRDYFTRYENRSAYYYDPVVFAQVANVLLAADPPMILLTHELNDASPKWRFYATKVGRMDLLSRTRYVDSESAEQAAAPPGSLLVVLADGATLARLTRTEQWAMVQSIDDIDHREASVILRKLR